MVKVHLAAQVRVVFSVQVQDNQQQVVVFLEQVAQIPNQHLPLLVDYLGQNQLMAQVKVHCSVIILQLHQKQVIFLEGLVTRLIHQSKGVFLVQVQVDKLVASSEVEHLVVLHQQQEICSVQVVPIQFQVLVLILHLLWDSQIQS